MKTKYILLKCKAKLCLNILFTILLLCNCSQKENSRGLINSFTSSEMSEVNEDLMMMSKTVESPHIKKTAKTWKRSNKTVNAIHLYVGENDKIPLKGLQQSVTIDGFRARVLIDCFYYNDKDFNLEGTFKMKLPQGAKPYYFAFGESVYLNNDKEKKGIPFVDNQEINVKTIEKIRSNTWSAPKVARVVPKEKAAFAYNQTVRRRVDPALAEWAGADIFNCSVFPLTSKKLHRIVIGYDVNLTSIKDDAVFNFPISDVNCPLLVDFNIADISGITSEILPQQNVQSKKGRKTFRLTNPKAQDISIRYKNLTNIALQTVNEEEVKPYFSSLISPDFPKTLNTNITENAILALDVSLSSNPDKFNLWLKMTEAILLNNSNTIKKFNVILFNIEASWWKPNVVENTPENVKAFLNYANSIALEGASDLGLALSEISNHKQLKNSDDNIFLLSDGAVTWGESGNFEISKHINKNDVLFAYNTGLSGTSINKLNHLVNASGGAIFSITGEDEIKKASTAFTSKPWRIENISIAGAKDVLTQGCLKYIYPGQKLLISGRGILNNNSKIKLSLSQNATKKDIIVPINQVVASNLTARIYGQIATDILETYGYATEKESIAYAKHFSVPGKTCSLLILETEEDYKQYNIKATEDAYVVNSTQVKETIDLLLSTISNTIGNGKVKFKNWLTKLSNTVGVNFKPSTSLDIIVNKLPKAKFTISQKNLLCKTRFKNETPLVTRDSLFKEKLNYDIVTNEALRRKDKHSVQDALKVLSSLVERNPGDAIFSRDVAYSALDWGLNEQAYYLLKRVIDARPYEPQTYLAVAQALAKIENYELALIYYEIAITANWDDRFGEFRKIAALDYLNLLGKVKDRNSFLLKEYADSRYTTLKNEFDDDYAGLMVTISWNTDNTDIDLHVIEPTGEECYYSHPKTKIGGKLTKDVTTGYGPEMYLIKDAKRGKYKIKAKYYSSNRNRTSTRTKIFATIYKNWGKKNETVINKTVTLEDNKDMHKIMVVDIK